MPKGDNWTKEETQKTLNERARKVLKKAKDARKGRKYSTVYVGLVGGVRTWKEVEVKPETNNK